MKNERKKRSLFDSYYSLQPPHGKSFPFRVLFIHRDACMNCVAHKSSLSSTRNLRKSALFRSCLSFKSLNSEVQGRRYIHFYLWVRNLHRDIYLRYTTRSSPAFSTISTEQHSLFFSSSLNIIRPPSLPFPLFTRGSFLHVEADLEWEEIERDRRRSELSVHLSLFISSASICLLVFNLSISVSTYLRYHLKMRRRVVHRVSNLCFREMDFFLALRTSLLFLMETSL